MSFKQNLTLAPTTAEFENADLNKFGKRSNPEQKCRLFYELLKLRELLNDVHATFS